ncbi:putative polypeptide N-acetylgalactosaminyltransferase 9 [Halyomorpha halys]|uniref:putative polypeptide N-acetylgalactosaminyltransferase 9 n=1 Tax=Halyomorpha halys TaxID=286706 RepID=UPI0006D51BB2
MRMLFSRRLRAVWSRLGLVALVLWGLVALALLWQPALPSPPVRSTTPTTLPLNLRRDLYGEEGKPVVLASNISADVKKLVDEGWEKNAFNQYVSDLISLHRSLPDPRDPWCKESARFVRKLPATSVIICFHNEAWSVLLRTVHSVIDRSPKELIKEIILVDDFSNMAHLKRQLEEYMAMYPVVKIIRAQRREGLIRARLLGAKHALGPVLTYLDSHCECAEGWLEPLLDRIARDPSTVVCPVIDVIDDSTLEYHWRDAGGVNVGGFDWNLQFNWHVIPEREKKRHKNQAEPVYSPTMAGGLFSIDKNFFERLGTYDSGFDIWGGENLELSFKVRNLGYGGKTCLDSPARKNNMHKPVGLYPCHNMGGNQYWMLSKEGEIRRDEACLDYAGQDVILYPCHGSKGNQLWIYNHETNTIQHGSSKKCLAISESKQRLLMAECNLRALEQHWRFENFNATKLSSAQPERS